MKTEEFKCRLTEGEKQLLKEKAAALNMSLSDYFKWCCLINPPKPNQYEREEAYKTNKEK